MRRLVSLACALAMPTCAHAQAAALPESLQSRLEKLAGASEDLRKRLPSFACSESVVSEEVRGGKVKMQVKATGDLRVQLSPEGKLVEDFKATEVNGRPLGANPLRLPIFVIGGFKGVLDYFRPEMQSCYRYMGSADRIEFESLKEAAAPVCKDQTETRGFVVLNDAGDITHLERSIGSDAARERNAVPFAALDLSRLALGGSSFMLSTHVIAEGPAGKSIYRWEATYTGCLLFHVAVTIGPANGPERPAIPDPPPSQR